MPSTPPAVLPRDRILQTAHDLFYRHGIRATGIDKVIAESGVAKVTFYRQFASKEALILAFLDYRHQRWMTWFREALARHGNDTAAIVPTMREWFHSADFRGCAFLNSTIELGPAMPEVLKITRGHKDDMIQALARLAQRRPGHLRIARALAVAIDGAIVQAQFRGSPEPALDALDCVVHALT